MNKLFQDRPYRLRRQIKQNFDYEECNHKVYPEKTEIVNVTEHNMQVMVSYSMKVYIMKTKFCSRTEDVY